jgi:hypothetical protein
MSFPEGALAKRLILLVGFSLAVAAWPIGTSAEEITPAEFAILAAAFVLVVAVQCGALWIVSRFASGWLLDALVVLLIAANAYHFAFLTFEGRTVIRMGLSLAIGLGAGALLRAGVSQTKALMFTLIFAALSLGQYAYGRVSMSEAEAKRTTSVPGSMALKSDRNVYLISTESLHSPYAFRRLYGIEQAPHVAYLKSEGFRVLERSYSVDTNTRRSYRRIMEFSKPLANSWELNRIFRFGNSTFQSFQDAGYGVQFIYISNYMGLNHALVDHAYPPLGFYVCDNQRQNFFYFICRAPVRSLVNSIVFGIPGKVSVSEEIAHLKERIGVAAADAKPWLTISHIAFPTHTADTHSYDDVSEREEFRATTQGRMPQIADHYRQIVTTIKERDPDAIIVTFGDHGMLMSRGMASAKPNSFFSTEDYIEDRYGAMLGVYPADFCSKRIFEGSSTRLLVKNVIECLNGNDNPTPEEIEQSRSVVYMDEMRTIDSIAAAP